MMTAKDYRQQAWQRLSGNWGTMVLAYLIFGVISGVLAYTYVGPVLLGGVLSIGVASVSLSLMRTGTTSLEYLFDGFKYKFGNAVLASLLYNIFIALWSMLFLIPGLVKTYSYAMTYYIMRDNPDMSANDAITASRKMMDGNKARLFGLHFSFFGWILLAGVTCGIGFLFVMPYMQAAQAAFYEDLKRKQTPGNNFYNNQQYAQPQQPYGQQYAQPQQPYAQPQPYGGMPYAAPIKNYMVEAVLTTLFCCMPFGIVAIIFASQVSGHQACGRIMEAQKAANNAKIWSLVSLISGLVFSVIYFFLLIIGELA